MRIAADGKIDWKEKYGDTNAIEFCTAALLQPGGVSWLAGPRVDQGLTSLSVVQLAPTWEAVWVKTYDVGSALGVAQVLPQPGGGVLVVGKRGDTTTGQTWLAWIAASGQLLGQKTLPNPLGSSYKVRHVRAAALRSDGSAVLVGAEHGVALQRPFSALVKPDGEPWAIETLPNQGAWNAVAAAAGDHLLLAGPYEPTGSQTQKGRIEGDDGWLNGEWSHETGAVPVWYGAAAGIGHGWLAVGAAQTPTGVWRPILLRTDSWGRDSCAESGVCAVKPAQACDDGKACTIDGCGAVGGCSSQVVPALRCLPDDACSEVSACTNGACQQTDNGRLFLRKHAAQTTTYALSPLADGSVVVAGTTAGPQAWVGRTDAWGNLGWSDVYPLNASPVALTFAYAHAVAPTADGGFLVAANGRENDKHIEGCTTCLKRWRRLRKYTATKGLGWEIWSTASTMQESDDLVAHGDGTWSWLWRDADGARATRLNQAGAVIADKGIYAPPYDGTQLTKFAFALRGAPLPNGEAWVAGWRWQGNVRHPWAVRLDAKGDPQAINHTIVAAQGSSGHMPIKLVAAPDGGFFALLHRLPAAGGVLPVLARFDPAASAVWQQPLQDDANYVAWELAWSQAGELVVAGEATKAGELLQWFDRRNPAGQRLQRALLPLAGPVFALRPVGAGDLLVGGRGAWPDTWYATLVRASAWGQPGCKAAGVCAAKTAAACDDGAPCTADLCDAAQGCQHAVVAGCK